MRFVGTRMKCPAWSCTCAGDRAWRRREAARCVSRQLDVAVRVRTSCHSHCKNRQLRSSVVLWDFWLLKGLNQLIFIAQWWPYTEETVCPTNHWAWMRKEVELTFTLRPGVFGWWPETWPGQQGNCSRTHRQGKRPGENICTNCYVTHLHDFLLLHAWLQTWTAHSHNHAKLPFNSKHYIFLHFNFSRKIAYFWPIYIVEHITINKIP